MSDYTDKDKQARAEIIAQYERSERVASLKKWFRYAFYALLVLIVVVFVLFKIVARDYKLIPKMGRGAILEVYLDGASDRAISKTEAIRVTRWLKENNHSQAQSDALKRSIQQNKSSVWRGGYLQMIESVVEDSPKVSSESELKVIQAYIRNHVSDPYYFGAPRIMIEQGGIKPEDYIKKMKKNFVF